MKNYIKTLSKKLKLCLMILAGCGVLITNGFAAADSKGTDFWVMFDDNYDASNTTTIFITSDVNTSGTVDIPGLAFTSPFVVVANTVTSVVVPTAVGQHTSDVIDNKGIHVTALQEVTVYGSNYRQYSTDAYLGLPTDVLGTDYLILTYKNVNIVNSVQLGIVGTVNGTTVTITLPSPAGPHLGGIPYNIVLQQGQTYQLENTNAAPADLTGTVITSDQPIGVFAGSRCANIPAGAVACDHICEMLPPTTTWGKKFGTVPLKTRINGDTWRFLASQNTTSVTINGVAQPAINRGEYVETILTANSVIESDKPILVAQFANGSSFSGEPGDPFMMLIPPLEQFLPNYTLTTVSGYVVHHINVVAPNAVVGTLTLDGVAVPAGSYTAIGASGFSGAQLDVADGSHTLNATLPFGAFMYGFNTDDSYGYPGGQSFAPIATATSLTLTPVTGTGAINTNHCWNALVKDQFDSAVVGVRVDFNVTGVNPNSSFAFTDANGNATFCYTGTNGGLDSIIANLGSLRDTSTFLWTSCQCISCDGQTVVVDSNVTINFNTTVPTYTGDQDLKAYYSYDKTGGPTADLWKAIFTLGSKKLLIKNGVTITVTQVPNSTNNRRSPGILFKSDCDVEIENGGHVTTVSLNQNAGSIVFQIKGHIVINGEILNQVTGTQGNPGAISITSKCGNITVGQTGLIHDLGTGGIGPGGGGNVVSLTTCGAECNAGDITVNGLVKAFTHNTQNQASGRPIVRVVSLNGTVTVNANTAEPLFDEYLESGTLFDIYGGLLSWTRDNVIPGKVEVQAKNNVIVNGHGTDPTGPVRKSFGAIAAIATMSDAPGGQVDVRSVEGSISGDNRSFDVSGRNRLVSGNVALIRLWAKNNITLTRSGANNNFNPVVDASSPSVGDKGGKDSLRAFIGGISLGANVLVSAAVPIGLGSVQGVNELISCTGITGPGTVVPPDPTPANNSGVCTSGPAALYTDCSLIGGSFRLAANGESPESISHGMTVYPNPTNGKITMTFDNSNGSANYTVQVYDVTGRMMINDKVDATEGTNVHEIDLSYMAKGMYVLILENGDVKEQTRIIVK